MRGDIDIEKIVKLLISIMVGSIITGALWPPLFESLKRLSEVIPQLAWLINLLVMLVVLISVISVIFALLNVIEKKI